MQILQARIQGLETAQEADSSEQESASPVETPDQPQEEATQEAVSEFEVTQVEGSAELRGELDQVKESFDACSAELEAAKERIEMLEQQLAATVAAAEAAAAEAKANAEHIAGATSVVSILAFLSPEMLCLPCSS